MLPMPPPTSLGDFIFRNTIEPFADHVHGAAVFHRLEQRIWRRK
jgi:hypothetical protein